MTLYKDKFKVDSNRLKNWDYSSAAVYFITIVTKNRECLFGFIEEDKMILNENGQIVENELLKSIKIRKNWFFHNWIVMPNHVHLLIEIMEPQIGEIKSVDIQCADNESSVETHCSASPPYTSTHCASAFVKSTSALDANNEKYVAETHCNASLRNNHVNKNENKSGFQLSRKPNSISSFVAVFKSITTKQINGSVSIWQSNYHDHIVRNYKRFETIYNYIKANPRSWETDSMKL